MIQRSIKRLQPARARRRRRARRPDRGRAAPCARSCRSCRAAPSRSSRRLRPKTACRSIASDSAIHAVLIDWTLGDDKDHDARARVPASSCARATTRSRSSCMAERGEAAAIPIDVMEMVDEFIWTLEDTAAFVGGRVVGGHPPLSRGDAAAAGRGDHEVHAGVRVLLAHAGPRGRHGVPQVAGRPHLLRLLRREPAALRPVDQRRRAWARCSTTPGPMGEHERYAARVFGAHRTY